MGRSRNRSKHSSGPAQSRRAQPTAPAATSARDSDRSPESRGDPPASTVTPKAVSPDSSTANLGGEATSTPSAPGHIRAFLSRPADTVAAVLALGALAWLTSAVVDHKTELAAIRAQTQERNASVDDRIRKIEDNIKDATTAANSALGKWDALEKNEAIRAITGLRDQLTEATRQQSTAMRETNKNTPGGGRPHDTGH